MGSGSLEELLNSVDYEVPAEGLEDNILDFSFSFPKKPVVLGVLTAAFANAALTLVPLYYSIAQSVLSGPRNVKYHAGERLLENSLLFIPGFIFGAAYEHNLKVREGVREKSGRIWIESAYNFAFEHPEVIAVPAAVAFYQNFNSYSMLPLASKDVIAGIAYAGDIFRSCLAGIIAYSGMTFLAGLLHTDSLRFYKNAFLSRFFEMFGNYGLAAKYQKAVAEFPSIFSIKNHSRLGDLYLKSGSILEAIDEYSYALRKNDGKKAAIPSDIFNIPLSFTNFIFSWINEAKKSHEKTAREEIADKIRSAAIGFRRGRLKEADTLFRDAIMLDRTSRLAHIVYSHFLYGIGREEEGNKEQLIANRILYATNDFRQELEQVKGTRNIVYIESVRL